MGDTLNVSVIVYRDEVLVEVLDTDEYGQPDAITYQFAFGDDPRTLNPKQSIESEHTSVVQNALAEEGYQLPSDPSQS